MIRNEKGIALVVAIFALTISMILIGAMFWMGVQEQQMAINTMRVVKSLGVAEEGVAERIATWYPDSINHIGLYPTDSFRVPLTNTPDRTGAYDGWIYHVSPNLFLINMLGSDRDTRAGRNQGLRGAKQQLGVLVQLAFTQFDIRAALTTQGGVQVQGNAAVQGTDINPTGWANCDPADTAVAGIRTHDGSVTTGGNGTVNGDPPVQKDPTLVDSNFTVFGGETYTDLANRANITLPGGTYKTQPSYLSGQCNKLDKLNWGDGLNPTSPCGTYFPIIHVTGDITLNGVQGQGILLIDGNLLVQGSYEWYGIVVVLGELATAGGGVSEAHFWGGVLAKNADLSTESLAGKAVLNYSRCGILRALQGTSKVALARSRSWMRIY